MCYVSLVLVVCIVGYMHSCVNAEESGSFFLYLKNRQINKGAYYAQKNKKNKGVMQWEERSMLRIHTAMMISGDQGIKKKRFRVIKIYAIS